MPKQKSQPDASPQAQAPAQKPRKRRSDRKRPIYHKLPDYAQEVLLAFLNERQEDAMRALQSSETILLTAPTSPTAQPMVDYWKRVLQAIDWLKSCVNRRQRFLVQPIEDESSCPPAASAT